MARGLAIVLAVGVILGGCSGGGGGGGATQAPPATNGPASTQATGGGATQAVGGGDLLAAATAAKDHLCTLLPTDLVAPIVPSTAPPSEEQFPPRCSVFGSTSAMAIWVEVYNALGDPPTGSEAISGLGSGAYGEALAPTNYTLYVGLGPVGELAVEVNHAGAGQKDEAIAIAKAVLAKLASG